MSEELLQTEPISVGRYSYYKLGATTIRQLKQAGIVKAVVPHDLLAKKPDGVIVLPGGVTKAVIEYKPPNKLLTVEQVQAAIDQERAPAAALCKLLIVTSGTKSIWVNALNGERVRSEDGSVMACVVDARAIARGDFDAGELERLIDAADASLTETTSTLSSPSVLDPSALAASIWQKIWVQTGKSPEKCLYNVVELFVFKFLSDLGVLQAHNGFWSVVDLLSRADAKAALKHYANTCRKDVQELFPPSRTDDTTIINGTIFVNERGEPNLAQSLLFAEIVKNLADYDREEGSFRYIKREFKTRLYESFLRQSAGVKVLGQYFTPRNVVQAMVRMARPLTRGARICDPFCGVGGFLLELLMEDSHLFRQFVSPQGRVDPQVTLVGYDKGTDEQEDERTIILAKANMLIYFSDLLAEHHTPDDLKAFAENGLNAVFRLLRDTNLGTFDRTADEPYDLILTNPPYVTKGSKSLKDAIAQSERTQAFYDLGLKGTEGLALNWILKSLRTGGEAFVIVPDSLLLRTSALEALRAHCLVRAIVSLPSRTFYSTPRRTYILAVEKKRYEESQSDPLFAYIVGETGETRDNLRLEIEENHLEEMVPLFQQFRAAPNSFCTDTLRCRVVPFVEVAGRCDWRVDRWWSHEERVELGLDQRRPVIDHLEFVAEVECHAAELREMAQRYRAEDGGRESSRSRRIALCDPVFSYVSKTTGWTRTHLHVLAGPEDEGGTVPVYTAAGSPVGFTKATHGSLIQASDTSPAVSFASNGDGSAGKNFVLHTRPFYVTRDRTVLQINNQRIDPAFVIYALRHMKVEHGFDHTHKAVPKNLAVVSLAVPITESGEWDLDKQRRIAIQQTRIRELCRLLRDQAGSAALYDVEIQ